MSAWSMIPNAHMSCDGCGACFSLGVFVFLVFFVRLGLLLKVKVLVVVVLVRFRLRVRLLVGTGTGTGTGTGRAVEGADNVGRGGSAGTGGTSNSGAAYGKLPGGNWYLGLSSPSQFAL